MLRLLRRESLLPAVVFSFSKVKCDDLASGLVNGLPEGSSLSSDAEVKEACEFYEECVNGRLSEAERSLPQLLRVLALLRRGVGVHHSGMLPIVREMTEILFSRNLIKVLLATETFAIGVNMPARCAVFNGIRKNDGRGFRELLPGEYTQMSGRAGRRGIDAHGVCIVAGDELYDAERLEKVMVGEPPRLSSHFGMTYSMLLNLARNENNNGMRCKAMIHKSFLAHRARMASRELGTVASDLEEELNALPIPDADADGCTHDELIEYYDLLAEHSALCGKQLQHAARCRSNTALTTVLPAGRVIVLTGDLTADLGSRPRLAVLLGTPASKAAPEPTEGDDAPAAAPATLTLRCLLASQQSGALPPALNDVPFAPSPPSNTREVECIASGTTGDLRWDVLNVDACHTLMLCNQRLSVSNQAFALPVVEASVKGVAMQLAGLQRKHRFNSIEAVEPAVELQLPPPSPAGGEEEEKEAVPPEVALAQCGARAYELRELLSAHPLTQRPPTSLFTSLNSLLTTEKRRRWLTVHIDELSDACAEGLGAVTLLPDAAKRLQLLRKLGYLEATRGGGGAGTSSGAVEEGGGEEEEGTSPPVSPVSSFSIDRATLTLKGRVACELTTAADELLLAEAVCTGVLHGLTSAELAGLLSLFVAKGKVPKEPYNLTQPLQAAKERLNELAINTTQAQVEAGCLELGPDGEAGHVKFALNECMIAAAHAWAGGADFATLRECTMLQEGDIVRVLSRVEELAKEVKFAAWLLGDAQLGKTSEAVLSGIKRDVAAVPSLYTDGLER